MQIYCGLKPNFFEFCHKFLAVAYNHSVKNPVLRSFAIAAAGVLAGAVNGFFGGGGGMIVVPALVAAGLEQKRAQATAIAVMLPLTAVSAVMYIAGGNFPAGCGIPAALGVCAGGAAGAALLKRTGNSVLGFIFAAVVLAAGVRMLFF